MTAPRVLVLEAGVAGLSAALHLRRTGLDVTVIDRAPPVDAAPYAPGRFAGLRVA